MGKFNMQRLSTSLLLISTALLLCSVPAAVPSRAMAFELDTVAATVPGGTAHLDDPDEAPLPAPLPSAKLEEDMTSGQIAPPENGIQVAPGTNLQLLPGTSLQIAPGTSLQMSTIGDSGSDNPADNRALIPSP
jgi:hypothetical protein